MNHALAERVISWHKANGGHCDAQKQKYHALRLLHEAVELCLANGAGATEIFEVFNDELGKHTERHGTDRMITPDAIIDEVADVAILLEVFAYYSGISIDTATQTKLNILNARVWAVDEHGVLWRKRGTAP